MDKKNLSLSRDRICDGSRSGPWDPVVPSSNEPSTPWSRYDRTGLRRRNEDCSRSFSHGVRRGEGTGGRRHRVEQ